jgi:tRNA (guanine-N7-)-methyltransferase
MRKKKNLISRLEAVSDILVDTPETLREAIEGKRIWVELGCGLGSFAAETAKTNPEIFYTAFERVSEAIVVAAEKSKGIPNILFACRDAGELELWFRPNEIERLYIQFCDPWHKKKHSKRRLTHRNYLAIYTKLLSGDGELVFKTDNMPLFEFTYEELAAAGWRILTATKDWHGDASRDKNEPMTEYESKFAAKRQNIGRITARARDF